MANFYKCEGCGAQLLDLIDGGVCEESGLALMPHNTDESVAQKHVPVVSEENGKVVVRVGAVEHPSIPEHHIEWIYIKTSYGGVYVTLQAGDEPKTVLNLKREEVLEVWEHCNIHGLWKAPEPVFAADFEQNSVACSPEFAVGCVDMTRE